MFSLPLSPDLTLTVARVTAALESVGDLDLLGGWLGVPLPVRDVINESHRGDRECKAALSEHFVNSVPGASWTTLAGALYYCEERKALRAVGKNFKEGKGLCGLCGNINIARCVYSMFMYRCLNACWQFLFLIHVPVIISVMDVYTCMLIYTRNIKTASQYTCTCIIIAHTVLRCAHVVTKMVSTSIAVLSVTQCCVLSI